MVEEARVDPNPTGRQVHGTALVGVVVLALSLSASVLLALWLVWPTETPAGEVAPPDDGLVLVILVLAAALGGLVRVLRSLVVSIGCRELRWRALRGHAVPFVGGIVLASLAALLLGVGLAAGERSSPYGLAALAGVAGVVADPAARRLVRFVGLKRRAT